MGFRYELFRRVSFGYKLLAESEYEDWFSKDRERTAREREGLQRLLNRIRAIHRVTLSMLWNRLDFQRRSDPEFTGRGEVEAVGRLLPETFLAFGDRVEHVNEPDRSAAAALERFSSALRMAEAAMDRHPVSPSSPQQERDIHQLLGAQVGFYRQLELLLGLLQTDAQHLHISSDRFSILSRWRGSKRRPEAPHIRPV